MALLKRDQILAADDRKAKLVKVDVPEWGGEVYVRVMTGAERDAFEGYFETSKHQNLRAWVALCCCCDDQAVDLFEAKDLEAVGKKSATALDRIFSAALRINKLRKQDVEQLKGNSDAGPSDDSSSGSRHL